MSAALADRHAHSTTDLRPPKLNGAGTLSISGVAAASLPAGSGSPPPPLPDRAGPPRPRSSDAPAAELSPARSRLTAHTQTVNSLEADAERTNIPKRLAKHRLDESLAALATLEAKQAAADAAFAAAVSKAVHAGDEVMPSPPAPDIEIQAAIAQARSACNAYRLAHEECLDDRFHESCQLS